MALRADQLEARLAKSLDPLYVIHGDEPLLALEAADAVRAAARRKGFAERVFLVAERGFDWSELLHAGAARSLFEGGRIVELRIPGGRPGTAGAQAIERYCAQLDPQGLALVSLPRLDAKTQSAGWFAALAAAGMVVDVWPVDRQRLPAWIAARLAKNGQRAAPEALEFLAARVEGNLLAAHQEVQKLALLLPPGELALEDVAAAVADVARYEYADLAESLCAGELPRYARVLDGLRGEGESAAGLAWRLGDELLALYRVKSDARAGVPRDSLFAAHRIWRPAQARAAKALARYGAAELRAAVAEVARIERMSKGAAVGEPWDALLGLGLRLIHGR